MTKREALSIVTAHMVHQLADATVADVTGYRKDELTEADHARLAEAIQELARRMARLVIVEHLNKVP